MLSSNLLEIELSFQTCESALRGLVERFRLASKFLHKLTQAEADCPKHLNFWLWKSIKVRRVIKNIFGDILQLTKLACAGVRFVERFLTILRLWRSI